MSLRSAFISAFLTPALSLSSAQAENGPTQAEIDALGLVTVETTNTMSDQAYKFINHVCETPNEVRDYAVVDKTGGQLILIENCQTSSISNALYGREIGDTLPNRPHKRSFAGRFDDAWLEYHPSYQSYLHRGVVLNIASTPDKTAIYGIHATTASKYQSRQENMADGDPSNNAVTALCIDTTARAMDKVIDLFNQDDEFNPAQTTTYSTGMTVFVLPSEDTSFENTLAVTGLSASPIQNQSYAPTAIPGAIFEPNF